MRIVQLGVVPFPIILPCELIKGYYDTVTELHFLGGCKTIGGSACLVKEEEASLLCDFGASFNGNPTFPPLREISNLTVALSHAHLDHSGGLPLLFMSGTPDVYMTEITRDLIRLLLKDMLRLSQYYLPFEQFEVERLFRRIKIIDYDDPIELANGITLTFLDAGHIPGSAALRVNTPTHEILYTGDINTIDTQLLKGANVSKASPDALVLESTYALSSHKDRTEIEEEFVETAATTIDNGGTVLVPAFAVARAQEILCILTRYKASFPIHLDGMAREAARIFLKHPGFFRDYKLLQRALKNADWVHSRRQRETIAKKPGLIVAPAGMLRGGSAAMYLGQILHDAKNAVLLVGYQIPGTPGRDLLDNGTFDDGNYLKRVKAKYQLFDFSSHAGQDQLLDLGRFYPTATEIFTVHGETEACTYLAKRLRKQDSINARAVEIGERIGLTK